MSENLKLNDSDGIKKQLNKEMVLTFEDEEINLYEVVKILFYRKYIVLFSVFLFFVCGIIYIELNPTHYLYVSLIEIGSRVVGENPSDILIERFQDSEALLMRLSEEVVPKAKSMFKDGDKISTFDYNMRSENNGGLIKIVSVGLEEDASIISEFHTGLIDFFVSKHEVLYLFYKNNYQLEVEKERLKLSLMDSTQEADNIFMAKMKLEQFENKNKFLESQLKTLGSQRENIILQIEALEKKFRKLLVKNFEDSPKLSQEEVLINKLFENTQIEMLVRQLSSLTVRLNIDLEDKRQAIENRILDNNREWILQKNKVRKLESDLSVLKSKLVHSRKVQESVISWVENKIAYLLPTKVLWVAKRSNDSLPVRRKVIPLSIVLGGMFGVLAAFFTEFIVRSRRRLALESEGQP